MFACLGGNVQTVQFLLETDHELVLSGSFHESYLQFPEIPTTDELSLFDKQLRETVLSGKLFNETARNLQVWAMAGLVILLMQRKGLPLELACTKGNIAAVSVLLDLPESQKFFVWLIADIKVILTVSRNVVLLQRQQNEKWLLCNCLLIIPGSHWIKLSYSFSVLN
mgnify:CR=1 FL=1